MVTPAYFWAGRTVSLVAFEGMTNHSMVLWVFEEW